MIRALLVLILASLAQASTQRAPAPLPRTILAMYNGAQYPELRDTRIHRLLEMPLNHLGFLVRYHDLRTTLPTPDEMKDVRGIVTWFKTDSMPHPVEFLEWGARAIDSGKRFVIIGELSVSRDDQGHRTPPAVINSFLSKMGLRIEDWTAVTYNQHVVYQDPAMIGFERPLPAVLPAFDRIRILDPRVQSHLTIRQNNDRATDAQLVLTGPFGGWVGSGYTHFASDRQDQLAWYINPFEFLRLAFGADDLPKPDTTTLSGRRIYYSQIDGDGWRNLTEVTSYAREKLSSAAVVFKEAIEPFPDLPVTVGPIAGDLDPDWFGTRDAIALAQQMLSLPWVEAGSHTYSHPLDWETLYQTNPAAAPASGRIGLRVSGLFDAAPWTAINRALERYSKQETNEDTSSVTRGHSRTRSYTLYPFDPDREIGGSVSFLNSLLPPGKHVAIMQWSGTTMVPESVLRATARAGLRNINGGDTRLDPEFNSYAWVAPLSRQVGTMRQVYSSDSNENIYTNSWNERYFGFRYLPETLRRTESPMRIKPFNLYYHMYSGEKQPGIDAITGNLKYARSQDLAPITASKYAAVVDGFHSTQLAELGPRRWRIDNRDGLDTIRFDHADADEVDWAASAGVVGERHFQGSLYVALDSADRAPVIALAPTGKIPSVTRPYLVQSRWMVSKLCSGTARFEFESQGFGAGEMEWKSSPDAQYDVLVSRGTRLVENIHAAADRSGSLRFTIGTPAISPLAVRVLQRGNFR